MKLSPIIEQALRNFLVGVSAFQDQTSEAQELLIKELDKGKDRDLRNVMDPIIAVGEKSRLLVQELTSLWENPEVKENEEELAGLVAAVRASNTGDLSELEDLPEDLAEMIKDNLQFNLALNSRIESAYGKDAMTRALVDDDMLGEFERRIRIASFGPSA